MSHDEAKKYLLGISRKLGNTGMEDLTDVDGENMRVLILGLYDQIDFLESMAGLKEPEPGIPSLSYVGRE